MELPELEYYSFSQLLAKWNCDKDYLHHLIAQANIIPAIRLPESKQIPTGVFIDGIPDSLDGMNNGYAHQSYQEYCNATDESDPLWYEKLKPFTSLVYCQAPQADPTNDTPNNYIFSYFSKHSDLSKVNEWFYVTGNIVSNRDEGERVFLFTKEEIARVEQNNVLTCSQSSDVAIATNESAEDINSKNKPTTHNQPKPVRLKDIASAFNNLNKYGQGKPINLKQALEDKVSWVKKANLSNGRRGRGNASTWDPIVLAEEIIKEHQIPITRFTQAFQTDPVLSEWVTQWDRYLESLRKS